MNISAATDADWPSIYPIFARIVEAGETYAYPEDLTSDAARALWVDRAPGETVVALRDSVMVGTAKFGPNRPARGSHVATASFMVDAAARGSGVGRAMCEYAIAWAKDHGYVGMQFNAVVSTNVNAIQLYKALGFVTVGTIPGAFDSATQGRVGLDVMYLEF